MMKIKKPTDFFLPDSRQAVFILLFLLGLALYYRTLFIQYFPWDDKATIAANPRIRDVFDLPLIWQTFNTRFLTGLSFAVNYALSGNTIFGFRLVNVLLHILNALLVYGWMGLTLKTPAFAASVLAARGKTLPLACAVIFLVHPLNTEAVNFITQRYVLLGAFFYLLTVILYLKFRLTQDPRYRWASLGTMIAAMFCKEFAFTIPLMLILVEGVLFGRKQMKKAFPFLLGLAIIPLTLGLTSPTTFPTARIAQLSQGLGQVDITRAGGAQVTRREYFLTQLSVLPTYLRLTVWPAGQNINYDYPVARYFSEPRTAVSALFLLLLAGVAVWTFKTHRYISLGVGWFFIALSVESSFIPIGHVIAEYRMYLALLGVIFPLAALLYLYVPARTRRGILIGLLIVLAVATVRRNEIWTSEIRLWEDTARQSARKPGVWENLGLAYLQARDERAGECFLKAIAISPQGSIAYLNMGSYYLWKKDFGRAMEYYEKAAALNPRDPEVYYRLGYLHGLLGSEKETAYYQRAIQLDPYYDEAYRMLAFAYIFRHDSVKARELIEKLNQLGQRDWVVELEKMVGELGKSGE